MAGLSTRHIGIDFDNTIVRYDDLFLQCALDRGFVRRGHPAEKSRIRDAVRKLADGEKRWQRLQATVYGHRMADAMIMDGFAAFIRECRQYEQRVSIISHKTAFAAQDRTVNLRTVACNWMAEHDFFGEKGLGFRRADIYFESTRERKIERIRSCGCTHFIDDLIEVLSDERFPEQVKPFLFSSAPAGPAAKPLPRFKDWRQAQRRFFPHAD